MSSSKRKPLSQEFIDSDESDSGDKKPKISKKKVKADPESDAEENEKGLGGSDGMERNDDGDPYLELSSQRRLTVRVYNKKVLVDIREYYEKDGKKLPGKKGISLSKEQWELLKSNIDLIDNAVKEKS